NIDQLSFEAIGKGFCGLEIGRQGRFQDYRDDAVNGIGLPVGVDFFGRLFIGRASKDSPTVPLPLQSVRLELKGEPAGDGMYQCSLRLLDGASKELGITKAVVHGSWIRGLVAVTASTQPHLNADPAKPRPEKLTKPSEQRADEGRFAFSSIVMAGGKVVARPERAFGPILWTTYTFANDGTLRLLMQAAPLSMQSTHEAVLEIPGTEPVTAKLDPVSRTALFRVTKLAIGSDHPFKVTLDGATWTGTVRAIPKKDKWVVASLSCNDATGFPHQDLVANVAAQEPDLITFHGDQIYEAIGGYGLVYDQRPNDRAVQSYLRKFAMHGWTWREILRDRPSVTLPDDHDVFHGNLWGNNATAADVSKGFSSPAQDTGGYKMSVEFVNAVHLTQTGNLPEPADPAACPSGIGVYFTRYAYGPLDFVILADRQFKSAPARLFPAAGIANGFATTSGWDAKTESAHPDAELLGPRQEAFLRDWAESPAPGARFRIALSQSPFSAPQTLPASAKNDAVVPTLGILARGEMPPDDKPTSDFDTNAWPQNKRNLALEILASARAVHLTGDQHLGSTGQYGIQNFRDGPWWLSSPAIANIWPRRWMPAEEGKNRRPGDPAIYGDFTDGFGNRMTIAAVANPEKTDREPARLFERAVGYAISRYDTASGEVSLESWPYWASPTKAAPDNSPYAGWPVVIDPKSGKRLR
nr:alkaline phosphatase D family protein [Akkermansiaceae bacterium]